MTRSTRMFEIIQFLRAADKPLTGRDLAERLEVTKRTIYRDIAALQAMRVPIVGEAGVGYVMRAGYDLPPLMLTEDEVEAIAVGLALLDRTGDAGLRAAAASAGRKIGSALPGRPESDLGGGPLTASGWTAIPESSVNPERVRRAIRQEEKIRVVYHDAEGKRSDRVILPIAITYYIESVVVAAWCESRSDFRHFRIDRMECFEPTGETFAGQGARLRRIWEDGRDRSEQ
jgi:predicted DNA-binding transcriptional regulator YafY